MCGVLHFNPKPKPPRACETHRSFRVEASLLPILPQSQKALAPSHCLYGKSTRYSMISSARALNNLACSATFLITSDNICPVSENDENHTTVRV